MCGIAGIMTIDGTTPSQAVLDAFDRSLSHRGPDGVGRFSHKNVALVQRRLSIIDLETGDQPIISPDGLVLSANGEVYNYLELRSDFPAGRLKTNSDCEPPLHLYQDQGVSFVDSLRGMYAISIYDQERGRLVLHRDPFGIKPLYYAETQRGFAFASEAQALIAAGLVRPEVRQSARDQLMQLQFTTGRDTIFRGIKRVLPGETLIVERGLIVEHFVKPALVASTTKAATTQDDALKNLDQALRDSVAIHQRADVPYGLFLSGGIDSSVLLSIMAEQNETPIKAFTAGFSGTAVNDERAHARSLAESVGADHMEVDFGVDDFLNLTPTVAAALDDPVADYAVLPTFKLAQEARKQVKVVLSGEGGDEIFGGYGRYRSYCRPWPLRKNIRAKGSFDDLSGFKGVFGTDWRADITRAEKQAKAQALTRLQRAQFIDCQDWLPHDLLIKLDRCLMHNAIEGRTPFLDPAVMAVGYNLADAYKMGPKMGKLLLREWLNRHMPAAKPFSKKRGFTVPVGAWMQRYGRELAPLVAAQDGIQTLGCKEAIPALFEKDDKRHSFAAWTLLFYALWHQRHILGIAIEGLPLFEALDAKS